MDHWAYEIDQTGRRSSDQSSLSQNSSYLIELEEKNLPVEYRDGFRKADRRVMMWGDGVGFMLTIGATLVAIPLMGCTVGSMLPLLLRRIGVDPATSSTPFIATLIDVLGIIVYFNLAQLFLAQVIAAHLIHAPVLACPPCPGAP